MKDNHTGISPAVLGLGLLYAFMLVFAGCKTPTPVVADCDPGFLPCENDQTQCCEVICSDGYYLCGPDSTDCCENCPISHLPCEDDDTACCEVICNTGYENCGVDSTQCCQICENGQLPCDEDTTQCCDVICDEGFYNCGPDSTDCCIQCPQAQLPCEDDITTCCEVVCPESYHNCGEMLTNCCIDTTSHQFSFAVDTLGIYGSYLNDVAIVNENNIWVVGNIETDSTSYNAAHYDGEEWELMGIYSNTLDLYSVYYISNNDIWVTDHCSPIHWDGNEWTLYHLQNMGLDVCVGQAIWGTSSSNMYFVGVNGGIVHYDGSSFVQMESGTDVDLKDIAGTPDGEYVFAVGLDDTSPVRSVILEYFDEQWSTLYYCEGVFPSESCQGALNSCTDVIGDTAYFVLAHVGLWKYNYIANESTIIPENNIHFDNRGIRNFKGQKINDFSYITYWSELIHYNGSTWYLDTTVLDQFGTGNIQAKSMDFKDNIVVSVGYVWGPPHAFIARGYRQ